MMSNWLKREQVQTEGTDNLKHKHEHIRLSPIHTIATIATLIHANIYMSLLQVCIHQCKNTRLLQKYAWDWHGQLYP